MTFNFSTRRLALAALLTGLLYFVPAVASGPTGSATPLELAHRPLGAGTPPLVVVVAQGDAVLSDFVVPYGVLARSGAARVVAVNIVDGTLKAGPVTITPDMTAAEFDRAYPQGADYVIVPATTDHHAAEIKWLRKQRSHGAALVSICDGVELLAEMGVLDGRRATGHWASLPTRRKRFPDIQWETNRRYVADGDVASSSGVSASLPISLALVAALAGQDEAQKTAGLLGIASWDAKHDSDIFKIRPDDHAVHEANMRVARNEVVAVMVRDGDDEVALSLRAEAWSRTMRNDVVLVSEHGGQVRLRGGLRIQTKAAGAVTADIQIVLSNATPAGGTLATDLQDIARRYGAGTARLAALGMEYPWGDLVGAQ
jgi:putative intracellular protease/amidase